MITDDVSFGEGVVVRDGARAYHVRTGKNGKIGNFTVVFGSPECWAVVGDDFFIGAHCYLNGYYGLEIGDRVTIAHGAMIFSDSGPNTSPELQKIYPIVSGRVVIGNDVWVGAQAIIMPGVQIGERVVIGAHSMVHENVPSGSVVAGTPARIVKRL